MTTRYTPEYVAERYPWYVWVEERLANPRDGAATEMKPKAQAKSSNVVAMAFLDPWPGVDKKLPL